MYTSPEFLETVTAIVTVMGGGWMVAAQVKHNRLEEKIIDNKSMVDKQWQRIDDLDEQVWRKSDHKEFKDEIKLSLTIFENRLDTSIRDIRLYIDNSVEQKLRPLKDSIDHLSQKMDRLVETHLK